MTRALMRPVGLILFLVALGQLDRFHRENLPLIAFMVLLSLVLMLIPGIRSFVTTPARRMREASPDFLDARRASAQALAHSLRERAERTMEEYSTHAINVLIQSVVNPQAVQERLFLKSRLTADGYENQVTLEVRLPDDRRTHVDDVLPLAISLGSSKPDTDVRITSHGESEVVSVTRGEAEELIACTLLAVLREERGSHVRKFTEDALAAALFLRTEDDVRSVLDSAHHFAQSTIDLLEKLLTATYKEQYLILLMPTTRPAATIRFTAQSDWRRTLDEAFDTGYRTTRQLYQRTKYLAAHVRHQFGVHARHLSVALDDSQFVRNYSMTLNLPAGYFVRSALVDGAKGLGMDHIRLSQAGPREIRLDATSSTSPGGDIEPASLAIEFEEVPPSSTAGAVLAAVVGTLLIWLVGSAVQPPEYGDPRGNEIDGDVLVFLLALPVAAASRLSYAISKTAPWVHATAARVSSLVTTGTCFAAAMVFLFVNSEDSRPLPVSILGLNTWPWMLLFTVGAMNSMSAASVALREIATFRATDMARLARVQHSEQRRSRS